MKYFEHKQYGISPCSCIIHRKAHYGVTVRWYVYPLSWVSGEYCKESDMPHFRIKQDTINWIDKGWALKYFHC